MYNVVSRKCIVIFEALFLSVYSSIVRARPLLTFRQSVWLWGSIFSKMILPLTVGQCGYENNQSEHRKKAHILSILKLVGQDETASTLNRERILFLKILLDWLSSIVLPIPQQCIEYYHSLQPKVCGPNTVYVVINPPTARWQCCNLTSVIWLMKNVMGCDQEGVDRATESINKCAANTTVLFYLTVPTCCLIGYVFLVW